MSYQVLARKWRPQKFSDVVGQQPILTALSNSLSRNRLHHAYLFSGTRGVGKTTLARLLAKGLNCEHGITATPCGECENCRAIEDGRFVDLLEVDAASRTKVEDTRDLLDNVQYVPARGRFKVYLIDEVHMLSRHSFNALLKTLEEPPEYVKFLLATTDPQKLPITILSRCLQFHLKPLTREDIAEKVQRILDVEAISIDKRALHLLAKFAQGSMRDALSLTDQAIVMGNGEIQTSTVQQMLGTLSDNSAFLILRALSLADGEMLLSEIAKVAEQAIEWQQLLNELLSALHKIAMLQLQPSKETYSEKESELFELARTIPAQDLQLYYQILLMGQKELALTPDPKQTIEMLLLRALAFHPKNEQEIAAVNKECLSESPPIHPPYLPVSQTSSANRLQHSSGIKTVVPALPPLKEKLPVTTPELNRTLTDLDTLSESTKAILQARHDLKQHHSTSPTEQKKNEKGEIKSSSTKKSRERFSLEQLACAAERVKNSVKIEETLTQEKSPLPKEEAYRWQAQNKNSKKENETSTPKELRSVLEYEQIPELVAKLKQESTERDDWAKEIEQLEIPNLVKQLALNAFKEEAPKGELCLHLRTTQRHLNTETALQTLQQALESLRGDIVRVVIVEDDENKTRTPLEWQQHIYKEKLVSAQQSILKDPYIQVLSSYFNAEVDEKSIVPV